MEKKTIKKKTLTVISQIDADDLAKKTEKNNQTGSRKIRENS